LLVFSFVDEHVLLSVHLLNRNMFWYVAVLTAILAVARSVVPNSMEKSEDPDSVLKELCNETHYFPRRWKNNGASYDTIDEMLGLYRYKVVLFVMEIVSVIVTPFILIFSLPSCAEDITCFVRDNTVDSPSGHVVGFSMFDFEKFGKDGGRKWYGKRKSMIVQGKMASSFLSFIASHPEWKPAQSNGGEELLQTLSAFRESQILEAKREDLNSSKLQESWATSSSSIHSDCFGSDATRGLDSTEKLEGLSSHGWLDRFFDKQCEESHDKERKKMKGPSTGLIGWGKWMQRPADIAVVTRGARGGGDKGHRNRASSYIELQQRRTDNVV